jgi:hypothetical protein
VSLHHLWLAVLLLVLAAAPSRAADAAQVRKAAADAARDLDVQQKLPNDSDKSEPGEKHGSLRWWPGGMDGPEVTAPAALWDIVQWAIIAIAVVAVLAWLGTWFSESYQRRKQSAVPYSAAKAGDPAASPLDPAQALALADEWAAQGCYGPAMHQVWLAAVGMLGPRIGRTAPDSLTSWELLRAANLQTVERQALRSVVLRVDRAWFGKQPAGLEDYQAVRGSYQAFLSAAGTGAA